MIRWSLGEFSLSALTTLTNTQFAPINIVLPAKPTGTAEEGQVLTSPDVGIWTGSVPISYLRQWFNADPVYDGLGAQVFDGFGDAVYIDEANIIGETGATYTVVAGDVGKVIGVRVTASNGAGSASANSPVTAIVTAVGGGTVDGQMDFGDPNNSGLLVLLEDI